jgi:hypothetical protein
MILQILFWHFRFIYYLLYTRLIPSRDLTLRRETLYLKTYDIRNIIYSQRICPGICAVCPITPLFFPTDPIAFEARYLYRG